ncbi:replicative DNA helicase [Deinococcus hopiensis]|uniref:DNA 5'-3' helicase n=1 Tax=Deinococcus hopiensis KR-140 TaxID=695939 RepID=A0A1W1V7Y6_9DEIO|nr:replicative DNA helicase [Deinococcus hopiensis]SMB89151.1 replicative DNA helicase [Deinococcus hopiensis KR-140]
MTARPLPQNHDLERQALACVLIDTNAWTHLADLAPAAWHNPATRELAGLMHELHAAGQPLDDLGLILQRAADSKRGQTVNTAFLQAVMGMEVSAFYAERYAAELRHLHGRREAIRRAHQLVHHASEGDLSPDELATMASQVGGALDVRSRSGFTSHAQAIDEALADMESEAPNAISTGFVDLDAQLLGWEPGAMYVLAARPAMGKSALGYSFVTLAAQNGMHAAVGSLEMPAKALTTRSIATAASVDLNRIRQRILTPAEKQRCRNAAARLRGLPITFMDAPDQTGSSIARDARKLRAAGKLDFLMIDYLQLIETGNADSGNRVQEVSQISRTLKKLAMELQIPIVVLSQLSRAVEARPNKRPVLSDLRESGAIEQDADTVMFIYRDEYYNPNTDQQGIAEVIVGKQRNGPVGSVKLAYNSEFVRFANLSRQPDLYGAA